MTVGLNKMLNLYHSPTQVNYDNG